MGLAYIVKNELLNETANIVGYLHDTCCSSAPPHTCPICLEIVPVSIATSIDEC